jgi:DNA (cytosine-5)-methyltransferase 1
MKHELASFFAGIGGIDFGFQFAGVKTCWANEIDENAAKTFRANHKKTELVVADIKTIKAQDIPQGVDVVCGGFPCQPFSIAGEQKGFDDDRGGLFFQITRIVRELKDDGRQPKVVFLENVKNLLAHDGGETYKKMKEVLTSLGYYHKEKILNSCEYGNLPQNRERLYIVAFLDKEACNRFKWPKKVRLNKKIRDIVDWNSINVPAKYFYSPSYKCYQVINQSIPLGSTHIFQYRRNYVRENKSGLCPTLTANMGIGGHNVPLIRDSQGRIRQLTPKECLLLQGFKKTFKIPGDLHDYLIYKQAGNSVSVTVIKRIARNIILAID